MRIASRNGSDLITRCRSPKLIRSQNALNFAYVLYLKLKSQNYNPAAIETYVRKWFVLAILTGRYSGPLESMFDFDIKNISSKDFKEYLKSVENAVLSDAFWGAALVQNLNTSVSSSPNFNVYFDELKEQWYLYSSLQTKLIDEQFFEFRVDIFCL
jgi:hypothetical protein